MEAHIAVWIKHFCYKCPFPVWVKSWKTTVCLCSLTSQLSLGEVWWWRRQTLHTVHLKHTRRPNLLIFSRLRNTGFGFRRRRAQGCLLSNQTVNEGSERSLFAAARRDFWGGPKTLPGGASELKACFLSQPKSVWLNSTFASLCHPLPRLNNLRARSCTMLNGGWFCSVFLHSCMSGSERVMPPGQRSLPVH